MKVQTEAVYAAVCARVGMERESHRQHGPTPTERERVAALLPEVAAETVAGMPPEWIDNARIMTDAPLHAESDGSGRVMLPADYLRLVAFRMSDWQRRVTDPITPSDPLYRLQRQPIEGLRGSPERPVCVLTQTPAGAALEYYTTRATQHRVSEALYAPRPIPDRDGAIDIPSMALPAIVKRIADKIAAEM